MQLQSPEAITQMAQSPYDPWAVMMEIQKKFELRNGGPLQPQQPQAQAQPDLGALLSGGAGIMKQGAPQAPLPAAAPMALPPGGRPAPVPQPAQVAPQQRLNIGQLLSRGPGYGL